MLFSCCLVVFVFAFFFGGGVILFWRLLCACCAFLPVALNWMDVVVAGVVISFHFCLIS